MKIALIDQYSKEELEQIVSQSSCLRQVIDKLGYSTHSGSNRITVKKRISMYGIDTSHFNSVTTGLIIRSDEQIFIQDSIVSQHCLRSRVLDKRIFPYICSICGQPPEWNGKELPLILDHINGKNHDNRIENIRWVCPNCNQQLPTTGSRNINSQNYHIEKQYYCKKCGRKITKSSKTGYCMSCSKKESYNNPELERDKLKSLIRTTSFTAIGKTYGVSDNAVRKWCKKLDLPDNRKQIKAFSDQEWMIL